MAKGLKSFPISERRSVALRRASLRTKGLSYLAAKDYLRRASAVLLCAALCCIGSTASARPHIPAKVAKGTITVGRFVGSKAVKPFKRLLGCD